MHNAANSANAQSSRCIIAYKLGSAVAERTVAVPVAAENTASPALKDRPANPVLGSLRCRDLEPRSGFHDCTVDA